MTRIHIELTAVLCLSLPSFAQSIAPDDLRLQWEQFTLQNGLRVLLQPDSSRQEVSIEFWVLAGIRDEEAGKFGLAHFAEHATPYGLRSDTTAREHLRSLMTNSNAQVRKDYSRFYIQVKPEALDLGMRYAADRFRADTSAITDALVERHRTNVLAEMRRNAANALWGFKDVSVREAATFGRSHPYGHGGYGTLEENIGITTHDIRSWYNRVVTPGNSVLFLVGSFDTEHARETIRREFSGINSHLVARKRLKNRVMNSGESVTMRSGTQLNTISLTWAIPQEALADEAALALAALIIDARLADSTQFPPSVDEAGSTSLWKRYEFAGTFGAYATFDAPGDSNAIETRLRSIVDELKGAEVTQAELEQARDQALKDVRNALNTLGFAGSRTELLGEGLLFEGNPDHYAEELRKQSELTPGNITSAVQRWLKAKPFRLLSLSEDGRY